MCSLMVETFEVRVEILKMWMGAGRISRNLGEEFEKTSGVCVGFIHPDFTDRYDICFVCILFV